MIKSLVVILGCVSLGGCFYQTTSQMDIKKSVKFCGSVEDVYEITVRFDGSEKITCTSDIKTYTREVTL